MKVEKEIQTSLSVLPRDVILYFLPMLPLSGLIQFSLTSKANNGFANTDSIWQANINYYFEGPLKFYEIESILQGKGSAKEKFQSIYKQVFNVKTPKFFDAQILASKEHTKDILKIQHIFILHAAAKLLKVDELEYLIFSKKVDPFFSISQKHALQIFVDKLLVQIQKGRHPYDEYFQFLKLLKKIFEQDLKNNQPDRIIIFVKQFQEQCDALLHAPSLDSDTDKQKIAYDFSSAAEELKAKLEQQKLPDLTSPSEQSFSNDMSSGLLMTVNTASSIARALYRPMRAYMLSLTHLALPSIDSQPQSTFSVKIEEIEENTNEALTKQAYKWKFWHKKNQNNLSNTNNDFSNDPDNDNDSEEEQDQISTHHK